MVALGWVLLAASLFIQLLKASPALGMFRVLPLKYPPQSGQRGCWGHIEKHLVVVRITESKFSTEGGWLKTFSEDVVCV